MWPLLPDNLGFSVFLYSSLFLLDAASQEAPNVHLHFTTGFKGKSNLRQYSSNFSLNIKLSTSFFMFRWKRTCGGQTCGDQSFEQQYTLGFFSETVWLRVMHQLPLPIPRPPSQPPIEGILQEATTRLQSPSSIPSNLFHSVLNTCHAPNLNNTLKSMFCLAKYGDRFLVRGH